MNKKTLLSSLPEFTKNWKAYKKQFPKCNQWIIISDYCIDDNKKPTDSITFSICPYYDLGTISESIDKNIPKDIKNVTGKRLISEETIKYIRDFPFFFSLSIIIRNKKNFLDIDELKKNIQFVIKFLNESSKDKDTLSKFNEFEKYLNRKQVNKKALTNMLMIKQVLASLIEFLIIKNNTKKILWVPDRDSSNNICNGIIKELTLFSYVSIIRKRAKELEFFGMCCENKQDNSFGFDNLIRYPDVITGVISSLNIDTNRIQKGKHYDIFVNSIANNKRIAIIRITKELKETKVEEIITQKKFSPNIIHRFPIPALNYSND